MICDRCPDRGMCCRYIELPLARALTLDEEHWVSLHPGLSVKGMGRIIRFEIACSALTIGGLCSLFGSDERPLMCTAWPDAAEQIPVGCAYSEKGALSGAGAAVMPR